MKYLLIPFLAAILLVLAAPTLAFAGDEDKKEKEKEKDKPIICKVKVQVKVFNAVNGTIYTVQLDNLLPQSKQAVFNQTELDAGDNNLAFMFQYKKGGEACPDKGSVEMGNVNGEQFAVLINSLTKVNKIGIELDTATIAAPPAPAQFLLLPEAFGQCTNTNPNSACSFAPGHGGTIPGQTDNPKANAPGQLKKLP